MQARRQAGVKPLAIVLPHPSITLRRRSSLLSTGSAVSPHTPSATASPTCSSLFLPTASAHRKSSDSWNSSIHDLNDDRDQDWHPDHVLLLSRTLDALPAHLLTPFHGAVPPSNLLDKIARGIAAAKGSTDWPHSIRATRVKLLELAKDHAKEQSDPNRMSPTMPIKEVAEEDAMQAEPTDYFADSTNRPDSSHIHPVPRKPLYRQSSMDFLNTPSIDNPSHTENIARLSNRLQRADRNIPTPTYHPYGRTSRTASKPQPGTRQRRCSSPPRPGNTPSLVTGPSTASSSTLASLASSGPSAGLRPRVLRRSLSVYSSASSATCASLASIPSDSDRMSMSSIDSCIAAAISSTESLSKSLASNAKQGSKRQRPRRAESVSGEASRPVKRAPSYGTLAVEKRENAKARAGTEGRVSPYPSSDEEEKGRKLQAKKLRTKNSIDIASAPSGLLPPSPIKSPKRTKSKTDSLKAPSPVTKTTLPRPRINPQRNPSMFGSELPRMNIDGDATVPSSPVPKNRTLRRVSKRVGAGAVDASGAGPRRPSLGVSRRISFGSLPTASEADDCDGDVEDDEPSLGSAFVLSPPPRTSSLRA